MTERRRAPIEVLERLAEAVDARPHTGKGSWAWPPEVHEALAAYRAATAPLRTETEVVLDIGHHVRACVRHGALMWTDEEKRKLEDLANEHTAPVPWDTPAPLRTRAEVDAEIVRTVRSCGESWWKSCGIESVAILVGEDCSEPTADEPERSQPAECDWCQDSSRPKLYRNHVEAHTLWICRKCLDERGKTCETTTDSGSSSATAAKESRDNAGASAGPAKEHEALPWDAEDQKLADPCSCDEALELRRVIKHVHSLALEVARVTEGA